LAINPGSREALEGLIVIALEGEYSLNLEQIRQDYYVYGDWFPFQVTVALDGATINRIIIEDGTSWPFWKATRQDWLSRQNGRSNG
jgi:hypothetical protein